MGGRIDTTRPRPCLVRKPAMGQITYAREIIDLTDRMLDFYVMASDRDQVQICNPLSLPTLPSLLLCAKPTHPLCEIRIGTRRE